MQSLHVVGAQPNFMKAVPVIAALSKRSMAQTLVHTGQHYDANMSEAFFPTARDAQTISKWVPDRMLCRRQKSWCGWKRLCRSGNRTGWWSTVTEFDPGGRARVRKATDRVAHVETGLRSRDRSMPKEINRLVKDHIADLLFAPSIDGN